MLTQERIIPIFVCLGVDRVHEQLPFEETWTTFDARNPRDTLSAVFYPLRCVQETLLPKMQHPQRPRPDADIVTYVHEGTMVFANPLGRLGKAHAGHFLFTRAAEVIYNELLDAPSGVCHLVSFHLDPSGVNPPAPPDIRYFTFAERRAKLRLVMSLAGKDASLRVPHDLFLYSGVLAAGRHISLELRAGRRGWLQVVAGEVTTVDLELVAGDGVGFTHTHAVSVTATTAAEILLLDLGELPPTTNGAK